MLLEYCILFYYVYNYVESELDFLKLTNAQLSNLNIICSVTVIVLMSGLRSVVRFSFLNTANVDKFYFCESYI